MSKINKDITYRKFRGKLAAVMDLDYDLSCDFHTPETLRLKFETLHGIGFRRINIVAPPFLPDDFDYTWAGRTSFIAGEKWGGENHLAASRAEFDNPMRQAVELARQAGLEVHAIFKPYEGGGFFTIPAGHRLFPERTRIDCLSGGAGVSDFIASHPDWRVKRRNSGPDDSHLSVDRMDFSFLLDEMTLYKANGEIQAKYLSIPDADIAKLSDWQAELFVSKDNASYEKLDVVPVMKRKVCRVRITDPNGFTVLQRARCLEVILSGFDISYPFIAVRFSGAGRRLIIPCSMVKVKHGRKILRTTISPTFRYNPTMTDVFARKPPASGDFTQGGFEFAESCPNMWRDWNVFGIARGHEPYLRGSLCEAVKGVRDHWLKCIQTLFDYGCDGVDVRLPSHCSGIADFANYGYNREIIDKFQSHFGRLPGRSKRDFIRIMRIRGDFFLMFLRAARKLADKQNRELQIHLRHCLLFPSLGTGYHENGFWAMPKLLPDWKQLIQLSDTVILSDNLCDNHFSGEKINVELPAKQYAKQLGKQVWAYCYLQQGGSFNRRFLNEMAEDPNIDGLFLYEVVYNTRENDGILKVLSPDQIEVVSQNRSLFAELLD